MFFKCTSKTEYRKNNEPRFNVSFATAGETFQTMGHKTIELNNLTLENAEEFQLSAMYKLELRKVENV